MADPVQHARELAAALLAELARLRRDAPDAELLDAERAARACASSLGAGDAEDTPDGIFIPPHPLAAPEDGAGQQDGLFIPPHPHVAPDEPSDS
jgi:hypothetical protein